MHGGEAAVSATRFKSLSATQQSQLVTFLKSL